MAAEIKINGQRNVGLCNQFNAAHKRDVAVQPLVIQITQGGLKAVGCNSQDNLV